MWKEVNLLSTNFSAKHTPSATLRHQPHDAFHPIALKQNKCLLIIWWSEYFCAPPPLSIQIKWGYNPHLPALTLSFLAFSTSSGIQFLASPTNTAVDRAMHRWPAAPKAAPPAVTKQRNQFYGMSGATVIKWIDLVTWHLSWVLRGGGGTPEPTLKFEK